MRPISERGSATLELTLLTPVLLLMLVFLVFLGRLGQARNDVDRAAREAARAASLARQPEEAQAAGVDAAHATLLPGAVSCSRMAVTVETTGFAAGGAVSATVDCTVELADVAGLGVPGATTLSASFREPLDVYRGVRP